MPQMSPYNWLFMFLNFNQILFTFMCYNYYFISPPLKIPYIKKKNFFFWVW